MDFTHGVLVGWIKALGVHPPDIARTDRAIGGIVKRFPIEFRPENQIGTAATDDLGQLPPVTFEVPEEASLGNHQVVVELEGVVVARASFSVTAE